MNLVLADPNRYEFGELLGEGGEGQVRRARCRRTGQQVAVKRLFDRRGQAFYRELAILTRLRHPNVVQLVDFFESGTSRFLVYEFCEGGSLADLMAGSNPLTTRDVLLAARQMASGLEALHAIGARHGDIKPGNILRKSSEPGSLWKLADFGLATDGNRAGQRAGYTPRFAAPEQLDGRPCQATDIYALGRIIEECCTLAEPPADDHGASVREDLLSIAAALTHNDPAARPSISECLRALQELEKDGLMMAHLREHEDDFAMTFGGFER
ncbi:protein kinase [bacterium]|nr:protein kinase [bacterium]